MSILALLYWVDDFWKQFAPTWQQSLIVSGQRHRLRVTQMYRSRDHDHRHPIPPVPLSNVQSVLHRVPQASPARVGFPTLVSYQRFVDLMPTVLVPWVIYVYTQLAVILGSASSNPPHLSWSLFPQL
jgi:hypothetical protein